MQDRTDLQMIIRTESCTQATDMRKGYAILFEIDMYLMKNGSEKIDELRNRKR